MGQAQMDVFTRIGSPNLPSLDYAAGGTRTSLKEFANAASPEFNDGGCNEISDFRAYHCFIPTASALAIKNVSLTENLEDLLSSNPDASPFDKTYAPESGNEAHSEVSERNLQEILAEILALDNENGGHLIPEIFTSVNPNDATFNFGRMPTVQLSSVEIQSGARITINKNIPTHYGNPADPLPEEDFFRVNTLQDCNASLIRVSNMGILEVGDPTATTRGELIIGKDASLQLDAGGQMIINPQSKLVIEDGGILRINPGCIVNTRGEIIVKPGGKIIYGGGVWKLDGSSSKVSLAGGQLHVLPGVTLDFSHNGSMGYLEVTADASQEIFCGAGAVIRLNGTGTDNTILRIHNWANLWNGNFNQGHLKLENGRVELLNNGQVWLDMRLTAHNVHFVDYSPLAGNSTVQVWYNTATFTNCQFLNVRLHGQDARCYATNSLFNGALTGIRWNGGLYKIKSCEFRDCGVRSLGLQNPSSVTSSLFIPINGFNNGGIAIEDQSLTKLSVISSSFSGADMATSKGGGTLSLACNVFGENEVAVHAAKGCFVIMDAQSYAGYNRFDDNEQHILLDNAGGLNLSKGYNQFGTFGYMNIAGTIAGIPCPSDCSSPVLDATANIWSPDGSIASPNPNFIDLRSGSFSTACSSPPAYFFCPIEVVDTNPAGPTDCQEHKLPPSLIKPQKSATVTGGHQPEKGENNEGFTHRSGEEEDLGNPPIHSDSFDGTLLDEALVEAASQMEIYDSTANDLDALNLFHEILTSGLDRSQNDIRWKMIWGREQMKTAFEHLVLDDEIDAAANGLAFSSPVQLYVDVLNLMTDTVLSDSTYRSQFYLELDKGQLFRTLGRSDIAREVFIHLADCQVDSLEQSVLNRWRAQAESELAVFDQYVDLGISPDDVNDAVDSSGFIVPVSYIAENYYFGLQINGPESLSFIGCQNEFGFKSVQTNHSPDFSLYPNPATTEVNIVPQGFYGFFTLEILDAMGRKALTTQVTLTNETTTTIPLPTSLAEGIYVVRLRNDHVTRERLLLIL